MHCAKTVWGDIQAEPIITTFSLFTSRALEQAKSQGQGIISRSDLLLKAPIYNPEKLICIGLNYIDHCTEQNVPVPVEPVVFSKFASAITEPNGPVVLSPLTNVRREGKRERGGEELMPS